MHLPINHRVEQKFDYQQLPSGASNRINRCSNAKHLHCHTFADIRHKNRKLGKRGFIKEV